MNDGAEVTATHSFHRYHIALRLLHWWMAGLVLLAFIAGSTIGFLGFDGLRTHVGAAGTDFIYTAHKSLGVLILGFLLLRLGTRLLVGKPAYDTPLSPMQRFASSSVHILFYVLLLAMPILGWLATAAGGFPVHLFHWELPGLIARDRALSQTLFLWHQIIGFTLLGLLAVHIGAAFYHWRVRKDRIMERMSLFPRTHKMNPPPDSL